MSKDQAIGLLLLIVGVLGIIIYGYLVFRSPWSILILKLTGFIAVAAILAIISWIGYTMATTPPPKPIEELELEETEEETSEKAEEEEKPGIDWKSAFILVCASVGALALGIYLAKRRV